MTRCPPRRVYIFVPEMLEESRRFSPVFRMYAKAGSAALQTGVPCIVTVSLAPLRTLDHWPPISAHLQVDCLTRLLERATRLGDTTKRPFPLSRPPLPGAVGEAAPTSTKAPVDNKFIKVRGRGAIAKTLQTG